MSRLVGVDLSRAVERIACLHIVFLLDVQIEQLEQRVAVIGLAIGSVELIGKELEHLNRWLMAGNNVLHHGEHGAALALASLEMFEFFGERDGLFIELRVEKRSDE